LDEIGNIPLHLQAKLLRVIQNRSVVRVGDTKEIPIDIRLICATNKDLGKMVAEGEFREDLYYRINTIHINLPPLRERIDEIEPLTKLFLGIFAEKYRRKVSGISEEALELLKSHSWSGNIRELRNCIEKGVILSEGDTLTPKEIELKTIQIEPESREIGSEDSLEETEKKAIMVAIGRFGGNLSMVAKSLGISRPTLYAKLKKYNI
jgi:transcriptional regulator with PAS, ATPase and Fis domain